MLFFLSKNPETASDIYVFCGGTNASHWRNLRAAMHNAKHYDQHALTGRAPFNAGLRKRLAEGSGRSCIRSAFSA